MTKTIIIDGADVSGCIYLQEVCGEEPYCDMREVLFLCRDNNCYYKQLQKLKEINKSLEDEYFTGLDIKTIAELAKKSIRLSKENRELEEENEKLRADLEAECENSDKKENELRAQLGKNAHLYKEKLREIKENLLYLNTKIAQIANDKLAHHFIQTALTGLNSGLADLIRSINDVEQSKI